MDNIGQNLFYLIDGRLGVDVQTVFLAQQGAYLKVVDIIRVRGEKD